MQAPFDQNARQKALDTTQSCVVQAPAGSGKTELLTRRLLRLLAQAPHPKAILAITFTQKAASEMRQRVLDMLQSDPSDPDVAAVLAQDARHGWDLVLQPMQLSIQTIDALCHDLAERASHTVDTVLPFHKVTTDPVPLYQAAMRELLRSDTPFEVQKALDLLLAHDNMDWDTLVRRIVPLLAQRQSWLNHVAGGAEAREACEGAFERVIQAHMASAWEIWAPHWPQWHALLCEVAPQASALAAWAEALPQWTQGPPPKLDVWHALGQWALTQQHTWRQRWTKAQGFLSPSSAPSVEARHMRELLQKKLHNWLDTVQGKPKLAHTLSTLLSCPQPSYTTDEWEHLKALLVVLPHVVACLQWVFQASEACDFPQLVEHALEALGQPDHPTELAMQLEHEIHHILMDEFQDTSLLHFRILERLVSGWTSYDHHTLFLVGDPMQSIYRFRQADVDLFHQVMTYGVGQIKLDVIKLGANFRSTPNLVAWVNEISSRMFPASFDANTSAIPHTPSQATQPHCEASDVHMTSHDSPEGQIQHMLEVIQHTREHTPDATIGMLVQTRVQAFPLIKALKQHHIPHHAVDMEPLHERMDVLDGWSLMAAICDTSDRLSWCSVLRAPWCGLLLKDLYQLAAVDDDTRTIWDRMHDSSVCASLSSDAQDRLQQVRPVLQEALDHRDKQPVTTWLSRAWTGLQGQGDIEALCTVIEKHTRSGYQVDTMAVWQSLKTRYSASDQAGSRPVEILTIHKAKGLAFDVVLLPDAQKRLNPGDPPLFLTTHHWVGHDVCHLLAVQGNKQRAYGIYPFARQQIQAKLKAEHRRLLYVATTRARHSLHISGVQTSRLPEHSFMSYLDKSQWILVSHNAVASPPEPKVKLKRLTLTALNRTQVVPSYPQPLSHQDPVGLLRDQVMRRILALIHDHHMGSCAWHDMHKMAPIWGRMLKKSGIQAVEDHLAWITHCLERMWHDPMGRWIVASTHQDSRAAQPLHHKGMRLIPDRSFIDDKGTRWIVDYHTSDDMSSELLEAKRAYLRHCAAAYHAIEGKPTTCGVYHLPDMGWLPMEALN